MYINYKLLCSQAAYGSAALTDVELHDVSEAAVQDKKMADDEISSLQTKLKAAQQQISLLEEELQTKERVTEESKLQSMNNKLCMSSVYHRLSSCITVQLLNTKIV